MEKNVLGSKIHQLRKTNNMSQQNLADKLCVSNKTISKWECGNGSPDVETLNKIANIFEISVDELLNENSKNSEEIITDNNNSISQKNVKSKKMLTTIALCVSLSIVVLVSLLCYFLIPKSPEIINTKLFSIDKNNSTLYRFINIFWYRRFCSYMWNVERVEKKHKKDFLNVFRKEFICAYKNNEINEDLFPENDLNMLKLIIH